MTVDELKESYISNVKDFIIGKMADEVIMRKVEEAYGIPEQGAYDFRISAVSMESRGLNFGEKFDDVLRQLVFDNSV